ncbi:MAG: alkaline phosphatase family protein [Actinobacteria bacterium]|nr:alkaline phosphatase family protein [Actinomycetota bacterium]MBW3650694.1 alkaline phosphatase family protein [Actinomycetota bacterium]
MSTGLASAPLVPDYGGACLANLVPALQRTPPRPRWLPEPVVEARQVVLLVLDGLGWLQLQQRLALAPTLAAMKGGPIHSVAPTTTACALASLTLGRPPAAHGIMGYRLRLDNDQILNVLRWRTAEGDARQQVPPEEFQALRAFGGSTVPVVTRAEFGGSGFTLAHLGGARLRGWREPSAIAVEVRSLLAEGEPFVYAYYDGIDHVAHERGFGPYYDAELVAADRIVADVAAGLPTGAALVVTADHGQVEVGDRLVSLPDHVQEMCRTVSGEGRFTWLHARPGRVDELAEAARAWLVDTGLGWVVTRDEADAGGWFGGPLSPLVARRIGDVALLARQPIAFVNPRIEAGSAPPPDGQAEPSRLRCRHGSLTPEEMLVPLLAVG